jgi:hypothetical protein
VKKKPPKNLRIFLHKAYLNLLKNSFEFIKIYYVKDRDIHPKRDPSIYASLVDECSLTEMRNKNNFLHKLFLKLQQNEFYQDYFVSRELLQLLFLPCFSYMEYYILLQHHISENGSILQNDLKDYFNFIDKDFKIYLKCLSKTYDLKKFNNLDYLSYNMRLVNGQIRDYTKNRSTKATYKEIQGFKHQSLGIQLMLLKKISKAETKKEIKKWCYELTSFVSRPDELYCGYV